MHTQLQLFKHIALIFYLDNLIGNHHHECIIMCVLLSIRVVGPDKFDKELQVLNSASIFLLNAQSIIY